MRYFLVCVGSLLLEIDTDLKSGLYTQGNITGENEFFLFNQLTIRESFYTKDGGLSSLPLSALEAHHLAWHVQSYV